MNVILCPIDFSEQSDKVLDYAVKFTNVLNTKLILFNAYNVPFYSTDIPVPEINIYEKQNFVKNELENLKKDIQKKYNLKNVSYTARIGNPADEIIDYAKEIKADWIILGARGASVFKKMILGSVANAVLEKATCPVLVVPVTDANTELKEIIFATQLSDNELPIIKEVVAFAKLFKAALTFVYVSNSKSTDVAFKLFNKAVIKEVNYKKIDFKKIGGKKVIEGLNSEVNSKYGGLIVMISHQGGTLRKTFGGSNIQSMFLHLKVPMLIYHSLGTILPVHIDPAEIVL